MARPSGQAKGDPDSTDQQDPLQPPLKTTVQIVALNLNIPV